MKLILLLAVLGAAYWGWTHFRTETVTDPVYAEFRVKYQNDLQLVGFGKMDSHADCERRADAFWRQVLAVGAQSEISAVQCSKQLPERYQGLFSNQPTSGTYVAMDRGNADERDGRFIIFGVASSDVMRVCPSLIETIKRQYAGTVKCVHGTVG